MRFKEFLLEEKKSKYKIYLDMDGVLVDFVKQYNSLDPKVDFQKTKNDDEFMWNHVKSGGVDFWKNMSWIEDTKKLIKFLKPYDVEILSAYGKRIKEFSVNGKKLWLKKNLPNLKANIVLRTEKPNFAKDKNHILIDDFKKNTDAFSKAGGSGIQFKNAEQTIKELKKILV